MAGMGTHDAVDYTLLCRKIHIPNFWVGRGESDNGAVENGSLHGAAHHGVREKCGNACVAIISIGIAEVPLESLPIHGVIRLEESEIWKQSVI